MPSPAVGVLVGSACAGYEPGGIPITTRPSAHPKTCGLEQHPSEIGALHFSHVPPSPLPHAWPSYQELAH